MHKELALPTLNQRRQYHMATECYESVNNTDSGLNYVFNLISNVRTRTTRLANNQGMTVPKLNSLQGRKALVTEDQCVGMT